MRYHISNYASGACLGIWEGDTAIEAHQAMLVDAGHTPGEGEFEVLLRDREIDVHELEYTDDGEEYYPYCASCR